MVVLAAAHVNVDRGWIGVGLDGTLAHYDFMEPGPVGAEHQRPDAIGAPIGPMVDHVKRWLGLGIEVRIVTDRVGLADPIERLAAEVGVQAWCAAHIGKALAVTATVDRTMLMLYEARAVQVARNTGQIIRHTTEGERH